MIDPKLSRRGFLTSSLGAVLFPRGSAGAAASHASAPGRRSEKTIRIRNVDSNFEREPLRKPLGFKGGYMTEKWQVASLLESDSGLKAIGLCSQSVLWSDPSVFSSYSEAAGNALMYAMLDETLQRVRNSTYLSPLDLLERVLAACLEYGRKITGKPHLRETFALMALVSLDNAAWLLYAAENGFKSYDEMIPVGYRHLLTHRHREIACAPLISYNIPLEEVRQLALAGYFFFKIKIGQPGTQKEMLKQDKQRLEEIHRLIGQVENSYTNDGKPRYYLDANGRYEGKGYLLDLLDHIEKIGASEQIAVIEEPFPEDSSQEVGDLGFLIAADESAHTDRSVLERIEKGYSALAIKGAAKTLSMSLRILDVAGKRNMPCFCADSAAIPILVDWNKNMAARIAPFPGLGLGVLESNGAQNYARWDQLSQYHPCAGASWTTPRNGVFELKDDFYSQSGGIFRESPHYSSLFAG